VVYSNMELPGLGKQCAEASCNQLDFLPLRCDSCENVFCKDHLTYNLHSCPNAYKKDVQVPVCPLCGIPVPVPRGQAPDILVGQHIDSDCKSDPAKQRRKIFTNRCNKSGCKRKEIVPVKCAVCLLNFCLKHRHCQDHECKEPTSAGRSASELRNYSVFNNSSRPNKVTNTEATSSSRNTQNLTTIQGTLSEDEALARALAESMKTSTSEQAEDDQDRLLAQAIAASQQQQQHRQSISKSCSLS